MFQTLSMVLASPSRHPILKNLPGLEFLTVPERFKFELVDSQVINVPSIINYFSNDHA